MTVALSLVEAFAERLVRSCCDPASLRLAVVHCQKVRAAAFQERGAGPVARLMRENFDGGAEVASNIRGKRLLVRRHDLAHLLRLALAP